MFLTFQVIATFGISAVSIDLFGLSNYEVMTLAFCNNQSLCHMSYVHLDIYVGSNVLFRFVCFVTSENFLFINMHWNLPKYLPRYRSFTITCHFNRSFLTFCKVSIGVL